MLQQLYLFKLCVLKIRKKIVVVFLNKITPFLQPPPPPHFFSEVAGIWVKVLLKATFYNTGTKKVVLSLFAQFFFSIGNGIHCLRSF